MMRVINFQVYPFTAKAVFTCGSCGKEKRTRSFKAECTVNPLNCREDGTMRTPREVMAQSIKSAELDRENFLRKPLCLACENQIGWQEREELRSARAPTT